MLCLAGVFGSPPGARAPAQPPVCAASGEDPTEPAGSGSQQFHPENQRQVRNSAPFRCPAPWLYGCEHSWVRVCALFVTVNEFD